MNDPIFKPVLIIFLEHATENSLCVVLSLKYDAVQNVIVDVYIIWPKAKVPTVEKRSIIPKPDNLLETYRNISHNKCCQGTA